MSLLVSPSPSFFLSLLGSGRGVGSNSLITRREVV